MVHPYYHFLYDKYVSFLYILRISYGIYNTFPMTYMERERERERERVLQYLVTSIPVFLLLCLSFGEILCTKAIKIIIHNPYILCMHGRAVTYALRILCVCSKLEKSIKREREREREREMLLSQFI